MCCEQAALAFDAQLVEQDVARVAQQLVVVHVCSPAVRQKRKARSRRACFGTGPVSARIS
jgi:hypothetical protein